MCYASFTEILCCPREQDHISNIVVLGPQNSQLDKLTFVFCNYHFFAF